MKPLVSVIIPTFNRRDAALRAVASVRAQTMSSLEVIVVDDGSTDDTSDAVAEVHDPRIRVIRHARNQGGSAARNTGMDAAHAPLIAFLDSDDEWMPKKLERNLLVANQLHGRWLLFNQQRILTDTDTRVTRYPEGRVGRMLEEALFVDRMSMQTSAVVLPTDLARSVRFTEGLPRLQDWDFYLRLNQRGTTFYSQNEALTVRRATTDFARISDKIDAEWLAQWIEDRRDFVSSRGYRAFMTNKFAPEAILCGMRWDAAQHIASGLLHGVIRPRLAAIEVLRLILPTPLFAQAARMAARRHTESDE